MPPRPQRGISITPFSNFANGLTLAEGFNHDGQVPIALADG